MGALSRLASRTLSNSWTVGAVVGSVLEVGGTVMTATDSIKKGDSFPVTLGKVAFDVGVNALLQGPIQNILYMGTTIGYDMSIQMSKQNAELQNQMKYTGSGRVGSGTFNMSNAGYTMRQRAINQIRSNGQNINFVLGNEARNYMKSSQSYN